MDSLQTGRLIYLILLLVVVGSYFFVAGRKNIAQMAQHALLWALIFIGVVAAIGLSKDVRQTVVPQQTMIQGGSVIELPRAADGHYYATLDVNGAQIPFMVDTGATNLVLTRQAAEAAGIDLDKMVYTGVAQTANGRVRTSSVTLDRVALGPRVDRGVRAMVNEGDMRLSLLGMSYLNRFSRIEIADGALRLTP